MSKKKSRLVRLRERSQLHDPDRACPLSVLGETITFTLTLGGLSHAGREGYNALAALERLKLLSAKTLQAFYRNFDEDTRRRLLTAMQSAGERPMAEVLAEVQGIDLAPAADGEDGALDKAFREAEVMMPLLEAMTDVVTPQLIEDRQGILLAGLYESEPALTRKDIELIFCDWARLDAAWKQVEETALAYVRLVAEPQPNGAATEKDIKEVLALEDGAKNPT